MIQSINDYENWRDSMHDTPAPDHSGPDKHAFRYYSHDYPTDTVLEYTRTGNRAELRLSFSSEDPDLGTEEMLYCGENSESMLELVSDLRAELKGYLDAADTSSFYQQQGLSPEPGIHSEEDYFGEYTRTALYAFEGILTETERGEQQIAWKPLDPDRKDWLYSANRETDLQRGCIGHLRGDFGSSGTEFWTSWFDHQPQLRTEAFHQELQKVISELRRGDGLLQNLSSMSRRCREGLSCDDSFGFKGESRNYTYCLRCTPRRGDYNFYLYAYDKNAQREHAVDKPKDHEIKQHEKPKIKKKEMER